MRRTLSLILAMVIGGVLPIQAAAEVTVGQPAPDFQLVDAEGQQRTLKEFRGRFVVLEWFNPECPFSKKHYDSGNMQRLQRWAESRGVAWLSIDSSAPGKQGHVTSEQAKALGQARKMASTAILLDPDGRVGKRYGAKTTPHMFLVNPDGIVIYQGAIDDRPSVDPADVDGATNYVEAALTQALAGRPVTKPTTPPYGCSVKY